MSASSKEVTMPLSWRRLVAGALFTLICPLTMQQARAEDGFIADQKGCKVSNPSPKAEESVSWSGPCVDGYADGEGLLQWYVSGAASTRYKGTLHRGALSGQGTLTMPNGARYAGQWVAGKQEGKGIQTMPDGSRYEGDWKNGMPEGHGVMRTAAGETFDGKWKEGVYVGPEEKQ